MRWKKLWTIKRRGLPAVLSVLMCMGAFGCAEKQEVEEASEEPVVLTMFIENPASYAGLQEDAVAGYIKDRFGIRIHLTANDTAQEENEKDSYYQLLEVKLQSNDMDDIMDFGPALKEDRYRKMLEKAAQSGRIVALDTLIEMYAPNISTDERMKVRNDFRKEHVYEDGKLYSLGSGGGVSHTSLPESSVWIRWDFYGEMGYPAITDDGELLDVLEKMQKENSRTPKGERIYALGMAGDDGLWKGKEVIFDYPATKGYQSLDNSCVAYVNCGDMSVCCPVTKPGSFFWQGMRFYYDANQRGLLDRDSALQSGEEYTKKVNRGIYLAGMNGLQMKDKEGILAGQGYGKAGFMPISPLADAQAVCSFQENVLGERELTVSSNCANQEKAMEFLDWCFSEEGSRVIQQGAPGLAWTAENGEYALTEEYRKDATLGIVDMVEKYGKEKYSALSGFSAASLDKEMWRIQIEQDLGVRNESPLREEAREHYDSRGLPDIVWETCMESIGTKPADILERTAAIDLYVKNMIFECIYARDDVEYEQKKAEIIKTVEEMGIQEMAEWYTKRMGEVREELMPILEDAVSYYIEGR